MALRSGDKDKEMGMPSSFSYNKKLNRDISSSKVSSSAAPINSSAVHGDTRKILNQNRPHQTLDHNPLYNPELNPNHQLQKSDADPATTVTATAARSRLKSPQQQQPSQPPLPPVGDPTTATTPLIRYRECLKNHAASMGGGHVVDGCGEFMPSGEEGTSEALKCAACECHRNFHRKEINGETQYAPSASCYYTYNPNKNNTWRETTAHHPLHQKRLISLGLSTSAPTNTMPSTAPVMMNFRGGGGGGPAESSSEDLMNMFHSNACPESSKKRFRTKFSQQQKDKMMEFADKLGWRIQKQDEVQVQQFCTQVGVKRQVFKVWMHNNKQAKKKKQM